MRADLSHLKQYRFVEQEIRFGGSGSPNFGILLIPSIQDRKPVKVIFSRGFYGWDHVSISKQKHPPSWNEMCWLKGLFFEDDETVMELHPPKDEWISNHDNCLHLWRPVDHTIPMPPPELVGVKGVSSVDMAKMSADEKFELQDRAIESLERSTGRNLSEADITAMLDKINFALMARAPRGTVSGLYREELIEALQTLNGARPDDPNLYVGSFEQLAGRLHRPGVVRETAVADESHVTKNEEPYRIPRYFKVVEKSSVSKKVEPGTPEFERALEKLKANDVLRRRPSTKGMSAVEREFEQRRFNPNSEEFRDDGLNQMDEDLQSWMDRDRE